jgi:hypothetical protein
MSKDFIDFISDAGKDGVLLAGYLATSPTKAALGAFFDGKGYTITDPDLIKLVEAKKNSKNRVFYGQEAFTPPGGAY